MLIRDPVRFYRFLLRAQATVEHAAMWVAMRRIYRSIVGRGHLDMDGWAMAQRRERKPGAWHQDLPAQLPRRFRG
jgi:hypothetical protein